LHGSSLTILYKIYHIHKKRALFEHVRFNLVSEYLNQLSEKVTAI